MASCLILSCLVFLLGVSVSWWFTLSDYATTAAGAWAGASRVFSF